MRKNCARAKDLLLLQVLLVGLAGVSAAQITELDGKSDAYSILSGKYKNVESIIAELRAIRAANPSVAGVHAHPPFELQTLLMRLSGMVPSSLYARKRDKALKHTFRPVVNGNQKAGPTRLSPM